MDTLPHRRFPCRPCPWRTDNAGRLAYPNLADYAAGTCGHAGAETPLGAVMFACHDSRTDPAELCAGWLAVAGYDHLTVRLAIAWGVLPSSVLVAGEGWPELFASYSEMAAVQAREDQS